MDFRDIDAAEVVELVEPEPIDIDVSDIENPLDAVHAYLSKFLYLRDGTHGIDLLVLWIIHCHFLSLGYSTPRLVIRAPMRNSGKTTVLEHVQHLTPSSTMSSSTTAAVLRRLPEHGPVTILIDEVEKVLRDGEDGEAMKAVINAGYKKSGRSHLNRKTGPSDDWAPVSIPAYSAIALCGISPKLADDMASRSIFLECRPAPAGAVLSSDWGRIEHLSHALRDRLAAWAESVADKYPGQAVPLPANVTNRAAEKWRPLMAAALLAGGDWPQRCARLAQMDAAMQAEDEDPDLADRPAHVALLHDIAEAWPADRAHMPGKELAELLAMRFPEAWGDGGRYLGKRLDRYGLRDLAGKFGIKTRRPGGTRVYVRSDFEREFIAVGIVTAVSLKRAA